MAALLMMASSWHTLQQAAARRVAGDGWAQIRYSNAQRV